MAYNSPPRRLSQVVKANGVVGETHEARNQDLHPDARISGHVRIGRRSAASRSGRVAGWWRTKTAASQVARLANQ